MAKKSTTASADSAPVTTAEQKPTEGDSLPPAAENQQPGTDMAPPVAPDTPIDGLVTDGNAIAEPAEVYMSDIQDELPVNLIDRVAGAAKDAFRAGKYELHAVLLDLEQRLGGLRTCLTAKVDAIEGELGEILKALHFHL